MSLGTGKKQLTNNIFFLTVVQIATYVLPLISVPVISRIIGPSKYGIINFGAAYVVYFNLLVSYSFDFSATRKISRDPDNEETRNVVFSEVFYTQCLLFIVATAIFIILLFLIPEIKAIKTVIIFSFFICIATLFTQNWLFQAMQDLSKVALFNLISRLLFTIAILIVVREKKDYIWQPFLIGIIQIVVSIWSFVWAYKKYKIKFRRTPLVKFFQVLCQERIIFFSLVFVNVYTYSNIVILGLYQNSEQVGYYTSAQRLIAIAQSVLTMPLAQAFYPYTGKAFGESRDRGLKVIQKLIPFILFYLGLVTIVMFILGPFAIRLFYGQKFEAAIPAFQILAITPLLFALNNVLGVQVMINLAMDRQFFKISAYAAILSIGVNLLLIGRWGYLATAINFLVTEIFLFTSMYLLLKRQGLNVINLKYFKLSALKEYMQLTLKKK